MIILWEIRLFSGSKIFQKLNKKFEIVQNVFILMARAFFFENRAQKIFGNSRLAGPIISIRPFFQNGPDSKRRHDACAAKWLQDDSLSKFLRSKFWKIFGFPKVFHPHIPPIIFKGEKNAKPPGDIFIKLSRNKFLTPSEISTKNEMGSKNCQIIGRKP